MSSPSAIADREPGELAARRVSSQEILPLQRDLIGIIVGDAVDEA